MLWKDLEIENLKKLLSEKEKELSSLRESNVVFFFVHLRRLMIRVIQYFQIIILFVINQNLLQKNHLHSISMSSLKQLWKLRILVFSHLQSAISLETIFRNHRPSSILHQMIYLCMTYHKKKSILSVLFLLLHLH